MDRRVFVDDKQAELEIHLKHMWPERWQQLYGSPVGTGDWGSAFDNEPELAITNADELDRWFSGLDGPRSMTGADVMSWDAGVRV